MLLKVKSLSCVQLFATPWTVPYHAPLSMGFSSQEYWSGLPFPSPEDLPDPGLIPGWGRSLGGGYGNPLQYCCLENPMDGGALAAYSPWDPKSQT